MTRIKSRKSKSLPKAIDDPNELAAVLNAYEIVYLRREAYQAELDAKIAQLKATYQETLDELQHEAGEHFTRLQHWAESHPDSFEKKKSITLQGHQLGFRQSTPACTLVKPEGARKKPTWAEVLENLKSLRVNLRARFLRTKVEINKDALLTVLTRPAPADVQIKELLESYGITTQQTESFYITLHRAKSEAAEKAA